MFSKFFHLLLLLAAPALLLAEGIALLPEGNETTPETHQLVWPTDAGVRYELEETTDLATGWDTATGYPLEAVGPVQQQLFTPQPGAKFFRVTTIDEQAPAIIERFPINGGFAIPRFGKVAVELSDLTGIDPATISLTVGALGSYTTSSPELTYADGTLTFDLGGDTALGGYGETITVTLNVADTLGNAGSYNWAFELETEAQVVGDLFVFGSPEAQRSGQQIGAIPTRVLAQRAAGGPIRMSGGADPWEIDSVQADRIVLAYTGATAPVFAADTYLANLTPASLDEVFYRKVISSSDDSGNQLLTLFTVDVGLEEMVTQGSLSTDSTDLVFEVDGNGVIQRAIFIDEDVSLNPICLALNGAHFTLRSDGFSFNYGAYTLESGTGTDWLDIELEEMSWCLTPSLQVYLDMGLTGLKRFEGSLRGDLEIDMVLDTEVLLVGSSTETLLFDLPPELELSFWVPLGTLGIVPVSALVKADLALKSEAEASITASLRTGLRQDAYAQFGLEYDKDDGIDWINSASIGRSTIIPTTAVASGELSLGVTLEPSVSFLVYGLAGAKAVLPVTGSIVCEGDTQGGYEGRLEADIDLDIEPDGLALEYIDPKPSLSFDIWEKSWHLFPDESSGGGSSPAPLAITTPPRSLSVTAGEDARFDCAVNRSSGVSYQWSRNGVPLTGGSQSYLLLENVNSGHAGDYSVRVQADGQTLTSSVATLGVWATTCDYPDTYPYADEPPYNDALSFAENVAISKCDWDFFYRQCTSYVAYRMDRITSERFFNTMRGGHFSNAENWAANADNIDFYWDHQPAVGAIAHWGANEGGVDAEGHVAYVEAVNPDGSVNLSEYNYATPDGYGVRCNVTNVPRFIHIVDSESATGPAPIGFAYIPAGSFQMGDSFSEGSSNELPVHSVYVSGFYMGRTEVTYSQWQEVYNWAVANGYTDLPAGSGKGANHPVHTVSWYDVVKWCNAASERAGLSAVYRHSDGSIYRTGEITPVIEYGHNGYRLPTEAEWEKAARGGLSGKRFPWGNTISHANANYRADGDSYPYDVSPFTDFRYHPDYDDGGAAYTSPVGSFAANGYGLYDMAGNLWEWCGDWYGSYPSGSVSNPTGPSSGSYRVFRGGGWNGHGAFNCRVSLRYGINPFLGGFNGIGFRLARSQ
jgi:formylglycine-generating enzyme required for sulfatase activity